MTGSTTLVVESNADSNGIRDFLAVDVEVVPRGYLGVPVGTAIHDIITGLFCSCEALRKDTDLNYCVFQLVLVTLENSEAKVTRSRLVREVALRKLEAIDELLDFCKFVEHKPQCYRETKQQPCI